MYMISVGKSANVWQSKEHAIARIACSIQFDSPCVSDVAATGVAPRILDEALSTFPKATAAAYHPGGTGNFRPARKWIVAVEYNNPTDANARLNELKNSYVIQGDERRIRASTGVECDIVRNAMERLQDIRES